MNQINNKKDDIEKDIIEEIHESRDKLLAKFDGDLQAFFDDARMRDESTDRQVVNREGLNRPEGGPRTKTG